MRARSYSKVNLWLRVVDKRSDGFHEIETVFHSISLHDELTIEPAPVIDVQMEPHVQNNLVVRAAGALAERAPDPLGASIAIDKRIPIGAGLAGGSGNAATALAGLNRLWALGLDDDALVDIAASLGSDVPFMLEGGTMLGQGRGERLTRLPNQGLRLWFVLGISHRPLSAPEVYRQWRRAAAKGSSLDDFRLALDTGAPELIAPAMRNDLEEPALHLRPELGSGKARLLDAGALGALVSGSGPTVFGLARDEAHARNLAETVGDSFDRVEVVRSHPGAVELES